MNFYDQMNDPAYAEPEEPEEEEAKKEKAFLDEDDDDFDDEPPEYVDPNDLNATSPGRYV